MVDLSGSLQEQLKLTVRRAVALQNEGKTAAAADEFERCAKFMAALVKEAITDEVKKKRLHKAKEYLTLSKKLRGSAKSEPIFSGIGELALNDTKEPSPRILSLLTKTKVAWSDIKGLNSVVYDIRANYILAGAQLPEGTKRMTASSILLYGPPGTGKTLLAAAASNELGASFFSVEVGSLLSKYFGESPQLVAELFAEARRRKRSLIFFDEIDELTPSRDKDVSEAKRSVLTAFLTGMDSIDSKSTDNIVYIMGATNRPWDIEPAVLSRMGKPVYIPLPDAQARELMFKLNLEETGYSCDITCKALAEKTQNYSGRDILFSCKEAVDLMMKNSNKDLIDGSRGGVARTRPISAQEMTMALSAIRPKVCDEDIKRYEEWGG